MVEDKEIKAPKSPFAMRENEIKKFAGKDGYASVNQVVFKIDMGYINELHFQIMEMINEFEFITSRQIFQLLQYRGIEIKSQDKVNKKLEDMIKSKIITRYYFYHWLWDLIFQNCPNCLVLHMKTQKSAYREQKRNFVKLQRGDINNAG